MTKSIFDSSLLPPQMRKEWRKHARFSIGYDMIDSSWNPSRWKGSSWDPCDYSVLKGAIDIHVHAGPGEEDEIAISKLACRAGMRAICLKNYVGDSTFMAKTAQTAINEYAELQELEPALVFGGLVLGPAVGALNLHAVRLALDAGAKKIWMPTGQAAGMLERRGMNKEAARERGVYILKGDKLLPAVEEIVNMVAEAGAALSTGHITNEEKYPLVDAAKNAGVKNIVIDHPELGSNRMTLDEQLEFANKGVFLNHCYSCLDTTLSDTHPLELAEHMKRMGAQHCVLSSDTGWYWAPNAVEAMKIFVNSMVASSEYLGHPFDQREMDLMTKENPAKILGL